MLNRLSRWLKRRHRPSGLELGKDIDVEIHDSVMPIRQPSLASPVRLFGYPEPGQWRTRVWFRKGLLARLAWKLRHRLPIPKRWYTAAEMHYIFHPQADEGTIKRAVDEIHRAPDLRIAIAAIFHKKLIPEALYVEWTDHETGQSCAHGEQPESARSPYFVVDGSTPDLDAYSSAQARAATEAFFSEAKPERIWTFDVGEES